MIFEHAFNTDWWGKPAGLVTDAAFFAQPLADQQAQLAPYDWVEYRQLYDTDPPAWALTAAGFSHADIQIRFKLGLHQVEPTPSLDAMEAVFASDDAFQLNPDHMAPFQHERFLLIPGALSAQVNARYALWANNLIAEQPEWSIEVRMDGKVQGWFVSRMDGKSLNLTLAMLHKDATISGMHLYHKAMVAYAQRGARIGYASYSATNTLVMGIYAKLGVRYLVPEGFWLWTSKT
ncbi:MAG: hypothetical protein ACI9TH_002531 [Kiritimatiellia bacterium]|jgi:hypothetical protein